MLINRGVYFFVYHPPPYPGPRGGWDGMFCKDLVGKNTKLDVKYKFLSSFLHIILTISPNLKKIQKIHPF